MTCEVLSCENGAFGRASLSINPISAAPSRAPGIYVMTNMTITTFDPSIGLGAARACGLVRVPPGQPAGASSTTIRRTELVNRLKPLYSFTARARQSGTITIDHLSLC